MFNCQFSNSYMGHFGRLVQNCRNSSALAMELLQSFTKPLTWVEPTHTDNRHSSGKHPCGVGLSLINFNVKPHGLSLINFNVKPHGQKDLKISVWQFIESCHGKLMTSTKVFMGPQWNAPEWLHFYTQCPLDFLGQCIAAREISHFYLRRILSGDQMKNKNKYDGIEHFTGVNTCRTFHFKMS